MSNPKKHSAPKREVRRVALPAGSKLEIRQNGDGSRSISGQAVVYNALSQDMGGFREMFAPGAFAQSLKDEPDVVCQFGHENITNILGRVASGTLPIEDTRESLNFTCKLPDTTL